MTAADLRTLAALLAIVLICLGLWTIALGLVVAAGQAITLLIGAAA